MEKKQYIMPQASVLVTEAEELLAGTITLNDESGSGSLSNDEVNVPGLSREDEEW
jgi:hypothetical protein